MKPEKILKGSDKNYGFQLWAVRPAIENRTAHYGKP